jgi:hypothetical protein
LRDRIAAELARAETEGENDEVRRATLRLIDCALRDRDTAARAADRTMGCDETEIEAILTKMVAQRKEGARAYDEAGRPELAERERAEIRVLSEFLPRPLSKEELRAAASAVVDQLGASGLKDLGRCMAELKARYCGRFDTASASEVFKSLLSS